MPSVTVVRSGTAGCARAGAQKGTQQQNRTKKKRRRIPTLPSDFGAASYRHSRRAVQTARVGLNSVSTVGRGLAAPERIPHLHVMAGHPRLVPGFRPSTTFLQPEETIPRIKSGDGHDGAKC